MTERLTDEALDRLLKMADSLDQSAANAERMVELLQPEFDAFEARAGHNTYVVRDYVDHLSAAKRQRQEASAIRELLAHRRATPADDPVAWQLRLSSGNWGTILHGNDKPIGESRPLYATPQLNNDLRAAASTILNAMNRAQIDMAVLRLFMNGHPRAALDALSQKGGDA